MSTHEKAARAWRDLEFAADAEGALKVANITLPIELARALVAERRAISALTPPDVSGLVEKTARAWASIDGKAVRFDDDKADRLRDMDGTFEGYMSEARELMKRSGLSSTITHLAAENALLREREGWLPIETAPKDKTRVILAWTTPENLPPHIELGYWSDIKASWVNTYGNPFSGSPDIWFTPPFPASPSHQEQNNG
jgi:hypothetical protein